MNETRVGYKTIDVLLDMTKDYIDIHTINGKYVGRVEYLIKYQQLNNYINQVMKQ